MSDVSLFSASQYEAVCASLPDPTFILTVSGRYAAIFGGKDKRYYHDGSFLLGKYLSEVLVPAKSQWFLAQIQQALSSQKMLVVEYELSARDVLGLPPDGPVEAIWFEGRITALPQLYGGEPAVVWVASNITASKQMQQLLHQQAMSDELTGLHNRRRLMQVLEQSYTDFCSDGQPTCVISFDVDHFKSINDGLGHLAGDQALRMLGAVAQRAAESGVWVCRLGGDEFAMVCLGYSVEKAQVLAQQVLQGARQALQAFATPGVMPSLSMGVTCFLPADQSVEDILRRVDQAMYASKTQGGHRVSVATASVAAAATGADAQSSLEAIDSAVEASLAS